MQDPPDGDIVKEDVFAFSVMPDAVTVQGVAPAPSVHVVPPSVSTLVPAFDVNVLDDTAWPFVSNVPLLSVMVLLVVNPSCNVQTPLAPLNTTALASVIPPIVTVLPLDVLLNVSAPVYVRVMNVVLVLKLPLTMKAVLPAHVIFPLVSGAASTRKSLQTALVPIVTV